MADEKLDELTAKVFNTSDGKLLLERWLGMYDRDTISFKRNESIDPYRVVYNEALRWFVTTVEKSINRSLGKENDRKSNPGPVKPRVCPR